MSALLDRERKINPRGAGRKPEPVRLAYRMRFHVSKKTLMPVALIEQIGACKCDEARRILLGVSK